MPSILHAQSADVRPAELYPGVRRRLLWQGASGQKALVVEMDAGARYLELQVYQRGPAEVFVVRGVFSDDAKHYRPGAFLHYPRGSTSLPYSREGCVLFAFLPDG